MTPLLITSEVTAGGDRRIVSPSYPLPVKLDTSALEAATVTEGAKAPAAVNAPEALVGVATLVATVTLYARRTGRVDNAGDVWWGFTAGDDTQMKKLSPGQSTVITAPPGKLLDLAQIYVDAETLTDGVLWLAMK